MDSDITNKIKALDKKIILMGVIDMPGTLLIGLGLYGKFAENENAFHPLLNNQLIVDTMIAAGAVIMCCCGYKILKLSREKNKLIKQAGM